MKSSVRLAAFLCASLALAGAAAAEPIRHPTAIFAGLDKITGRIINFDVAVDETVQFGALQLTPRVCNTRPQTETPQTTSFVEVDERAGKSSGEAGKPGKQETKRIFSGWMFASSPGLHGVEHPVYDVWLVDCKGGKEQPQTVAAPAAPGQPAADAGKAAAPAAPTPDEQAAEADGRGSRRVEPAAPAPVESQPIGPVDAPDAGFGEAPASIDTAAAPVDPEAPVEQPKKKRKKKRKPAEDGLMPEAPPPGDPLQPF